MLAKVVRNVMCGTALNVAISAGVAFAASDVTAQFHGGPAHLGVFEGPSPGNLLGFVWHFQASNRILASPVVADGVLFVGDKSGNLFALDAKTGAMRWRMQADSAITSTAAVSNGAVFFQSDSNTVYAVRASDGGTIWTRPTGANIEWHNMPTIPQAADWDYWTSSPLVVGSTLYIGSGDGKVYALNAASGAVQWQFATANRVRATPAFDGRTVYAGSFDGSLYALDARRGTLRWSFKTHGNEYFPVGEIQSSPAVANGLVFFGSRDFNLYAVDAKTGKEIWHNLHEGSWVVSTPAVADGRVIVGSSDGHFIRAVDVKTGTELWTRKTQSNVFGSAAIAGDAVYISTADGIVFGLSAKDGKPFTGMLFDVRVVSTPWIDSGVLFTASEDGRIDALTAGTLPPSPK